MLKDIWRVITGRLSWELVNEAWWRANKAEAQLVEVTQLKRDLSLAQAAITELKSQLPSNYEAKRKAASDALGDDLITDMHAHPQKYIGG